MIGNLQGWHLIIILAIVLLLFGAPKLPALARSVGQSMRIFKGEVKELQKDDKATIDDKASSGDSVDAGLVKVDENVTELKHKG
ncbi:Sec-independent protein translocase subunit TatA [Agreia sp. PsM10]|uniref:Sec-independent protein translocase subunit TatA n=1 Tax=Agreia sp. PsM10 TaxID=3030533 RepID=UPI00263B2C49|nr:Sec-independent protein translocase subunit TatA [Agreia sp. PsM10]MDN4641607.1 Sec-independent protein translocase subunit TatA [Agreia sp. PsM10]